MNTLPIEIEKNIKFIRVLGSGGFGKVYSAYDAEMGKNLAVKVLDKERIKRRSLEEYVRTEIKILYLLKGKRHIVRVVRVKETKKFYSLFMELAPNGELFDKIVNDERFDERTARRYFQQLIHAVNTCHEKGIVHRDLKAENLLLDSNNNLLLCDFGLSKFTALNPQFMDHEISFLSLAGSTDYQSPEILKGAGYSGTHCDMWACGCLLFFMLCGYLPFTAENDELTKRRIKAAEYNRENQYLSDGAAKLISHLLEPDTAKRYTCKDVIQDSWFLVDWNPEDEKKSPTISRSSISTETFQSTVSDNRTSHSQEFEEYPAASFLHAFSVLPFRPSHQLKRSEVLSALDAQNDLDGSLEEKENKFFSFIKHSNDIIREDEFLFAWVKYQKDMYNLCTYQQVSNTFAEAFLHHIYKSYAHSHNGQFTNETLLDFAEGNNRGELEKAIKAGTSQYSPNRSIKLNDFLALVKEHDILKFTRFYYQWRSMEGGFETAEKQSFASNILTSYNVYGSLDTIRKLLYSSSEALQTEFEEGETKRQLYGTKKEEGKVILEVGVGLEESIPTYTRVTAYRIRGKTGNFHEWYLALRRSLREPLLACELNTSIEGEAELM